MPAVDVAAALTERRVAATETLMRARFMMDDADGELITCDLLEAAPVLWQQWQDAIRAREAAEQVPRAGEEKLGALQARLERLQGREAEAAKAIEAAGDLDAYLASDVDASVNARAVRLAIAEEIAEVRQRIGAVNNLLSPPLAELRDAKQAEDTAKAVYENVIAAAKDPLGHPWARGTQAYELRMDRLYPEILAIDGHPDRAPAVEALKATLRASGIGADIQRDGIEAYTRGDPTARQLGPRVKRWPDGTSVIAEAGKPPVVYTGMTPASVAGLPT
jgi:hypothetical protein